MSKESELEQRRAFYKANAARLRAESLARQREKGDAGLARRRELYAKSAEKRRKQARERYAANPEAGRAIAKRYREANPEKVKASLSAWEKRNKEYKRLATRKYFANHPGLNKKQCKERYRANPEKYKAMGRLWKKNNREKHIAYVVAYTKAHPEKKAADTAKRRARKLKATPVWANDFFVKEAYHLAKLRSKLTGIPHHVDHAVPLRSKAVCGLHSDTNLRVIPKVENIAKSNRLWPNMEWQKGGNQCLLY